MKYHQQYRVQLALATIISRIFNYFVLFAAAGILPVFDASSQLITDQSKWTQPLMRWDSFHFKAIADAGYLYENQWAFFPGVPILSRLLRFGASDSALWFFIHLVTALDSTDTLHQLTRHHFPRQPNFAYLVCLLSLLPSSPTTLQFAPYAEPFFTCLSYKGMLYSSQQRWLVAAFCFTLATILRSNGILLSGYILWGLLVQPFWHHKNISFYRAVYAFTLTACVICPFLYHNYSAYRLFCLSSRANLVPEWCNNVPPSVYTYVQAKYWNVGFLRYWEFAQIPNFIIAAPALALLACFPLLHLNTLILRPRFCIGLNLPPTTLAVAETSSSMDNPSIIPHLVHTLLMCATFLFFSHTQIVLRLAAALPSLYWGAAWLLLLDSEAKGLPETKTRRYWGKMWVWWSMLWGVTSIGLWAAFLPPA